MSEKEADVVQRVVASLPRGVKFPVLIRTQELMSEWRVQVRKKSTVSVCLERASTNIEPSTKQAYRTLLSSSNHIPVVAPRRDPTTWRQLSAEAALLDLGHNVQSGTAYAAAAIAARKFGSGVEAATRRNEWLFECCGISVSVYTAADALCALNQLAYLPKDVTVGR